MRERECIPFDGEVSFADIRTVMGVPTLMKLLLGLAGVVLAPFVPVTIYMLATDRSTTAYAMPTLLFSIAMGTILVVLSRLMSRFQTKRMIKQNPGMIGRIHGELNLNNIMFTDETTGRNIRLTWSAPAKVSVNRRGLHMNWYFGGDSFIVVPIRSFGTIDRKSLARFVRRCRRSPSPAILDSEPDWTLVPPDSVSFQNLGARVVPASTRPWYAIVISSCILSGIMYLLVGWESAGLIGIGSLIVEFGYAYLVDRDDLRYGQWGWLTNEGFSIHAYGDQKELRWQDATSVEISDSSVSATFAHVGPFTFAADEVVSGNLSNVPTWIKAGRD